MKISAGAGIEIEVEEIWAVYIIAATVPRIQVDTAKIDDPEKRLEVLYENEIDNIVSLMRN